MLMITRHRNRSWEATLLAGPAAPAASAGQSRARRPRSPPGHAPQDKVGSSYLFGVAFFFFTAETPRFWGASLSPKLFATWPRWSKRTWKMCFSSRG